MNEPSKTNRLGRGLSALLDETGYDLDGAPPAGAPPKTLPIEFLRPNPFQPRKMFDPDELNDLTASIREKGILQPILVRPVPGESQSYQIVAGERRWRAAQRAAVHEVPVIIRELTDSETLEIAIIENVQRTDLNIIEEAEGYKVLVDQFGNTQDHIAETIGKSRSHVANSLRLLTLPAEIQDLIRKGNITAGHGRALLQAKDPAALAEAIIAENLNVREAESRARESQPQRRTNKARAAKPQPEKDADTVALQQNVSNSLGLKVTIDHSGDKGGQLTVHYKTLEQLDDVCRRLSREA